MYWAIIILEVLVIILILFSLFRK